MPEWTGQPAYKQVADDLRSRVRDGRLKPGDQLPSLAQLMQEFEASTTVVRMALAELRTEGLITTHQGKGAFVRSDVVPADASTELDVIRAELRDLTDRVERLEKRSRRARSDR